MIDLIEKIEELGSHGDYKNQAALFLKATESTLNIKYDGARKHFDNDEHARNVYLVTIKRGAHEYTFEFGQSLYNSGWIKVQPGECSKTITYWMAGNTKADIKRKYKSLRKTVYLANYKLPEKPSHHDILTCLAVFDFSGGDIGFQEFIDECGYDISDIKDYRKAQNTFNKLCEQNQALRGLFTSDELEALQAIN